MQNKKHVEDFDLFVKRSLQDAEMDVSPRVWKAIESRLDAAAAPRRGFRWAWVAVAAAAALAAAIIIPSTQNNSKLLYNNTEERIALASPIQEIEIRQIPSPRTIKIQTRLQEEKPETDTKQRVQENAGTTAQKAETTAQNAKTTAPSTETTEKQNKAELPPKQQYTVATEEAFAGIEGDDVKSKREVTRLSAYVNSSIGSNETAAKGAATASASNPNYIENDIKENSASNYSIPLSFGAGVRIHLSDKLAIGTGIDFSFLSRSFTGLYSP
ncbi:MAG: PorT family protein, partial [Rikenellaceae bacterium]|nr:PorT family protein [Rikenellaceae bacterium]